MADLDISEKNIRVTDMKEWIFEAVDKIGAPMQYITKESGVDGEPVMKIHDYQVPLPCGIQSLDAVAYGQKKDGPWTPMRTNTSQFKGNPHDHHDHDKPIPEKPITTLSQLYTINGMKYLKPWNINVHNDPQYFIKPGWIVTNQKEGYVKIAYKTIATDERGYPLIPDMSSYQEAVYWYVVMKLSFPKYLKGKLGGKGVNTAQNTYFYIQQQWNFYRNQAYAECMMPTAGDMDSIKNEWNKLVPDWDSGDTFFNSVGKRQNIYNDYYYGH